MEMAKKIRVGVLRGGPSDEYDVSLKTGETVLSNLPEKYHPIDIFISKDGEWHVGGLKKEPARILPTLDVVFNGLHGQYGEDGQVQKLMDHFGTPYTGSGSFASALAMNKHLTKEALKSHGVKMAYHKLLRAEEMEDVELHELFKVIPHPSVVKPSSLGSSVGVTIVKTFFDLGPALEKAFSVGDNVIVEEFIDGREATCGVVDDFRDKKYYALLPIEVIPNQEAEFYDYDAKYLSEDTRYVCPAKFSEEDMVKLQKISQLVHEVLGLKHYSRSDFIVHPKRGVYFLEVNTLPGMTSHSLIPKSLEAIGTPLPQFLDHVLNLALTRK